ncbi:MAG: methyltransferase domain-containing protein [bacterium]
MYKPFQYIPDFNYRHGWDKYALDYATLLQPGTIYYLTKEILHHLVDEACDRPVERQFKVLDVNCGTGNDFSFFLKKGWNITGIDGSAGMLNKAAENHHDEIQSGSIKLFQGQIETLAISTGFACRNSYTGWAEGKILFYGKAPP